MTHFGCNRNRSRGDRRAAPAARLLVPRGSRPICCGCNVQGDSPRRRGGGDSTCSLPPGLDPGRRAPLHSWRLPDGAALELVLVPAGPVALGRDDGEADLRPRHLQVVDAPFWIARAPVTCGAWRAFARATRRREPPRSWWPWAPGDDAPITAITRDDAQAFCAWAGLACPPRPSGSGRRCCGSRTRRRSWRSRPSAAAARPSRTSPRWRSWPPGPPGPGCASWTASASGARIVTPDGAYMAYALGDLRPPATGERRLARTPRDGPRARWACNPQDGAPALGSRPTLRRPRPADRRGTRAC